MAQEIIDIGTIANDGTGDNLRAGGNKANNNFTELYARTPNQTHSGDVTGATVLTLATVNADVGVYTYPASITVNAKGLITAITAGVGGLINKYTDTINITAGGYQKITTATTHPYSLIIVDSSDVDITSGLLIEYSIVGGFYAINIDSVDPLNNCQIFMLW